jgi:hypothetical protein
MRSSLAEGTAAGGDPGLDFHPAEAPALQNDLGTAGSLLVNLESSTTNGKVSALHAPKRARRINEAPVALGHSERRRRPRYHPVADRVWVEWWCDGAFTGLAGWMVNVSPGGAMIVIGERLRNDQVLVVTLEDTAAEVAIEAVVRGTAPLRGGVFQTRLEFLSPCPAAFFAVASSGFEAWLAARRHG